MAFENCVYSGAEFNQVPPSDEVLKLVERSMAEDLPLYRVLESVEKAILGHALKRHSTLTGVHEGLKIPKATFFAKKKRFFD